MPAHDPQWPSSPQSIAAAVGQSPTALRLVLGAQLRRLRTEAGVSTGEAAERIRGSQAKISRMERGESPCKERDAVDLLALYGVSDPGKATEFVQLVAKAGEKGWWRQYGDVLPDWFETLIGLEAAAATIRTYEVHFVPGLLQSADYARAVVSSGHSLESAERTERRVRLRMERQKLLHRPDAPRLWALIDESVLRRPVGGRQVMAEQIRHLLAMTELPNVTLQVAPFEITAEASPGNSITYLRFAMAGLSDFVYVEHLTNATTVDKTESIDEYRWILDSLSAKSPTPGASRELLEEALRRFG